MRTRPIYAIATACTVTLAVVAIAHAATDRKTYPAAVCVAPDEPFNDSNPQGGVLEYLHATGAVRNRSTTDWLTVVCPMVRDSFAVGGSNFPRLLETVVWVDRPEEGGHITCEVRAQLQLEQEQVECPASGCTYEADLQDTSAFETLQSLEFDTIDYLAPIGANDVYLICEIPPAESLSPEDRSSIISIQWIEETA